MSTAFTCTTPKEGWALYSHFLGNLLLVITMQDWDRGEESNEQKEKWERTRHDAWAKLAGCLYVIMRRMQAHGHHDTAAKMQQIVDMVATGDLTKENVRKAIHDKHREMDKTTADFEAAVDQLNAAKDSETTERGKLIEGMLDKIYPFDPAMPDSVREGVETDRQALALRSGWGNMPIEELRQVAAR